MSQDGGGWGEVAKVKSLVKCPTTQIGSTHLLGK